MALIESLYHKYMHRTVTFSSGISVPSLGFGTWQITGETCTTAVKNALEVGYRHIDTADAYGNHREVGQGITASGLKREEIFLTTKVWRDYLKHDEVIESAERFLDELGTNYLDLLLVHWPNNDVPIRETLSALQELQQKKLIRSIGVSNFTIPLLQEALATQIPIENLQIEFHPSLNQKELKAFCDEHQIVVTAYSPIAQGADLKISLIEELAKSYQKTASQIVLNWLLEKGMIVIPRSANQNRIKENLEAQAFHLSKEDIEKIDNLNVHNRIVCPPFAPFTR